MTTHSARLRALEGAVAYPQDHVLLRRLSKGEAEAFEPVLLRHVPGIVRYLRLCRADTLSSARIVSSVFGEAFRLYCPEGGECPPEPPEDFGLDLLALARTRAVSTEVAPDASAGKLAELPPELREALVLRHVVLTGYAGISRVTGEDIGRTASLLAAARLNLAIKLSADGSAEERASIWCTQSLGLEGAAPEALSLSLSRYLDEESNDDEADRIDAHIKECSNCRRLLAALRGADRYAAHVVSSVDGAGRVIEDVAGALGLRSGVVRLGRFRIPRILVWTAVAAASLIVGALVVVILNAVAGGRTDLRPVDLRLEAPEDGVLPPRWTVKRPGAAASAHAETGSRLAAGLEVALLSSGGHGLIARPDGAKLHAESGTRLRLAPDATVTSGITLERGRAFLLAPKDAMAIEFVIDGMACIFGPGEKRALIERTGDATTVSVLDGTALIRSARSEWTIAAGERLRIGRDLQAVHDRIDYRVFAMAFMPSDQRPSAWPARGGSSARSGNSPFRFVSPPARGRDLENVASVSACVLGSDGAAIFVVGPQTVRVVSVRGSRILQSPEISGAVGDPAIGPKGEVILALRGGGVVAFAQDLDGRPRLLFGHDTGEVPRCGPSVARDGTIYVSYGNGIAAFAPDGRRKWKQPRITSGGPVSLGVDSAFVATLDGRLHALSKSDGGIVASAGGDAGAIVSHVAVAPDGTAYAVGAEGLLLWLGEDGASARVALPPNEYPFAPAIGRDGGIVVASADGSLYSLPPRPTAPPSSAFFSAGEPFAQGPIIDGSGVALLLTESGGLIAVEPSGRSRSWDLDARQAAPLAITRAGGLVFATRSGRIFSSSQPMED